LSNPVRVTVTGAAGQIGYSIVFRIASGQLLGPDQPIDPAPARDPPGDGGTRGGVAMELVDCAFPLLAGLDLHDDPREAFDGVNIALLVGSRPRTKGMERAELLSENGKIFTVQGRALNDRAAADVKILVVGNPANTNCLIAMTGAPDIPHERFTSMMRLDHNRAIAQLANKVAAPVTDVTQMGVWGNHSPTMYPDLFHAQIRGERAVDVVDDMEWIEEEFLPGVGKRGAAVIEARGSSSAASAASAAVDHMSDWVSGNVDWVSMGVPSDGSYSIPEGLICGFPCICTDGELGDRRRTGARRLLTRQDRCLGGGADERARDGCEPGNDLGTTGRGSAHDLPAGVQDLIHGSKSGAVIVTAPLYRRQKSRPDGLKRSALRVPAAPLLGHLVFLLQAREHAVEVVLLDAHLRGQLGNRDTRLTLHEGERLGRARAAAFAPARASTTGGTAGFARRFRRGSGCRRCFRAADRAPRTPRSATPGSRGGGRALHAVERGGRCLQATVLVYERLQLFEPVCDLSALLVKEVGHGFILFTSN